MIPPRFLSRPNAHNDMSDLTRRRQPKAVGKGRMVEMSKPCIDLRHSACFARECKCWCHKGGH